MYKSSVAINKLRGARKAVVAAKGRNSVSGCVALSVQVTADALVGQSKQESPQSLTRLGSRCKKSACDQSMRVLQRCILPRAWLPALLYAPSQAARSQHRTILFQPDRMQCISGPPLVVLELQSLALPNIKYNMCGRHTNKVRRHPPKQQQVGRTTSYASQCSAHS